MGAKADHLRSRLASARTIADQAQGNSLKAEAVLEELERREERAARRRQAETEALRRRFPSTERRR